MSWRAAAGTWEVVVWDTRRWWRPAPPVFFESESEAQLVAASIGRFAACRVTSTDWLDRYGVPTDPPTLPEERRHTD